GSSWPTRAAPERLAENFAEDVAGIAIEAAAAEFEPRAAGASPTCAAERLERIAAARAFETGKTGLAAGVDLAAVELGALGLVAHHLVGLIRLGESFLGLRVVRILVRMIFLRELAERRLDVFRRGVLRNAQHVIGIAHRVLSAEKAL